MGSFSLTCFVTRSVRPSLPFHLASNRSVTPRRQQFSHLLPGLPDIVLIFFIVYRHEENRQRMVNSGVLAATHALAKQATRDQLLRISRVWVAMVQDDDIRWVFYGNVVF